MTHARRLIFGLIVLVLACASEARANMAKWWSEGESHGVLLPQGDTNVRVDSEDLAFVVDASLQNAKVTATYHLVNAGAVASRGEIAFVMVAAEHDAESAIARAEVTIDGAPVTSKLVTEADVLGPALEAWLVANPAADKELARLVALPNSPSYGDTDTLRRFAPGCTSECFHLVRWYQERKSGTPKKEPPRVVVLHAAEEAIPEQAHALQNGWSKKKLGSPLSWLTFPLAIEPGAKQTVIVRYTHVAGSNMSHAVNTVFTYDYLLSPAKRWASFGPLHVTIELPPQARLQASSLPFSASGTTYRADLPSLPEDELSFETMSRAGLFLGMTQPTGYWLFLLAVMALVTVPIGARLGRVWARSSAGVGRVLACLFGTGLVALVANGLVAAALSALFPQHAFGYSYGAAFGLILVAPLMALVGVGISLVTGAKARTALP